MPKIPKLPLALCCAAALYAIAVQPSATLLDNADVKVSRAMEKPHVKGSFHQHKLNRVMVYLQRGRQRFEYQDGRPPKVFDWKAGEVVWSAADGIHSPEIVSDDPLNIIEIEIKKPGAAPLAASPAGSGDALKLDPKHFKLEFQNDQVRVLRLKLGPHQSTPPIARSLNTLAICLTDQDMGTDKHAAGDVVWETPATQAIKNAGDKTLEVILIELRT